MNPLQIENIIEQAIKDREPSKTDKYLFVMDGCLLQVIPSHDLNSKYVRIWTTTEQTLREGLSTTEWDFLVKKILPFYKRTI